MTKQKRDIYQEVTNRIIEQLESGTKPWIKPWKSTGAGCATMPHNGLSGNNYQGVNTLLLWTMQHSLGYQSNTWLTFKQAKELDGSVRKGEKGSPVIYYQMIKRVDKSTGEETVYPMLKQYTIFNLEQCEDINVEKLKIPVAKEVNKTPVLELALNNGAKVGHGGDSAYFAPGADVIQMPNQQDFKNLDNYEATLLHELTHWTGHKSRLDRLPGFAMFGSESYAFEELVAELGSAFLGAEYGLNHEILQHDSYIESWLKVLKNDKKAIFKASKLAQQASEYLIENNQACEVAA